MYYAQLAAGTLISCTAVTRSLSVHLRVQFEQNSDGFDSTGALTATEELLNSKRLLFILAVTDPQLLDVGYHPAKGGNLAICLLAACPPPPHSVGGEYDTASP